MTADIKERKAEIKRRKDALNLLKKRQEVEVRVYIRNRWEDHGGKSVTVTTEGSIKEALSFAINKYHWVNDYSRKYPINPADFQVDLVKTGGISHRLGPEYYMDDLNALNQ